MKFRRGQHPLQRVQWDVPLRCDHLGVGLVIQLVVDEFHFPAVELRDPLVEQDAVHRRPRAAQPLGQLPHAHPVAVRAHDPVAMEAVERIYPDVEFFDKAESALEGAHALAHERYMYPELLSDHLRGRLEKHAPRAVYEAATRHVRECALAFHDLTSDFDVLLTPAAVGEAEKDITNTGSALFNRMWTLLGVPAVTVPAGRGPSGGGRRRRDA